MLCVDEQIIQYKGKPTLKQYNQKKTKTNGDTRYSYYVTAMDLLIRLKYTQGKVFQHSVKKTLELVLLFFLAMVLRHGPPPSILITQTSESLTPF